MSYSYDVAYVLKNEDYGGSLQGEDGLVFLASPSLAF